MAKHRYKILTDEAAAILNDPHRNPALPDGGNAAKGEEAELDLSAEQRRAMVAAGWISEPLDADEGSSSKSKGGKG